MYAIEEGSRATSQDGFLRTITWSPQRLCSPPPSVFYFQAGSFFLLAPRSQTPRLFVAGRRRRFFPPVACLFRTSQSSPFQGSLLVLRGQSRSAQQNRPAVPVSPHFFSGFLSIPRFCLEFPRPMRKGHQGAASFLDYSNMRFSDPPARAGAPTGGRIITQVFQRTGSCEPSWQKGVLEAPSSLESPPVFENLPFFPSGGYVPTVRNWSTRPAGRGTSSSIHGAVVFCPPAVSQPSPLPPPNQTLDPS